MAKDITIPPEALEAVAEAICDAEFWPGMWATLDKKSDEVKTYRKAARAACLAMLKHWPGMTTDGRELHFSTARGAPVTTVKAYSIILPLPTEKETSA